MNCPPDTNPKSGFGIAKPGIHSVPPVALLHCGRAMDDGVEKYGLTNWRKNEVSASVYYNAAFRHLAAWWDGEEVAPDSGVHHLGHVMACCAILLDAQHMGKLNDDRPAVPGPFAQAVKAMTAGPEQDPDRDPPQVYPSPEVAREAAQGFLSVETPGFEERVALVRKVCEAHHAKKVPDLPPKGRATLLREISEYEVSAALSRAERDCAESGPGAGQPREQVEESPAPGVAAAFDEPDCRPVVVLRENITNEAFTEIVEKYQHSDLRRAGDYYRFRLHVGAHPGDELTVRQRTRLAFYMEARMAGLEKTPEQLDSDLRRIGFEIG